MQREDLQARRPGRRRVPVHGLREAVLADTLAPQELIEGRQRRRYLGAAARTPGEGGPKGRAPARIAGIHETQRLLELERVRIHLPARGCVRGGRRTEDAL